VRQTQGNNISREWAIARLDLFSQLIGTKAVHTYYCMQDAIRWEYFVLVLIDKLFFGDLAEPLSYHG